MEEDLAIMMADLSGYTALTETHGSVSAADLIDKYVHIVEHCLVGDSILNERTGDEVMIVSKSPDSLLASALLIMEAISKEHNFLQVHGGLHYGKVLKRKDSFFGTAINLTSRIAAKASPGTFWCSGEFVDALTNKSIFKLQSKGLHRLKNIKEERELTELINEHNVSFFVDPVCRMLILDREMATKHPDMEHVFFCSPECLEIYISADNSPS